MNEMKQNICIFGSTGLLGRVVTRYMQSYPEQFHIQSFSRKDFDIPDKSTRNDLLLALEKIIHSETNVIINCIGLTNKIVAPEELFTLVNGTWPQALGDY